MATQITERLNRKRMSDSVQQFKTSFEMFLTETGADAELIRHLKKDLSAKMDMPYYKEVKGRRNLSPREVCIGFCELAISYEDKDFIKTALAWLCKQQGQSFRKISPQDKKKGSRYQSIARGKKIIWEHPIPVNYSKNYLYDCICKNDLKKATDYLSFLSRVHQVCLLKEENDLILKQYKDTMPNGWDYQNDSPYIRYTLSGMDLKTLGLI